MRGDAIIPSPSFRNRNRPRFIIAALERLLRTQRFPKERRPGKTEDEDENEIEDD